jgi:hypothetical protein
VSHWKKALLEKASELFEGKRGPHATHEQSDPERLYSEIGRLKVELDWLKKTSMANLTRGSKAVSRLDTRVEERRHGQNHTTAATDPSTGINLSQPALSGVWGTTVVCL